MKKFLAKFLLPKHKFTVGDLVKHADSLAGHNDLPTYEVEHLYYDLDFKPITIVRNASGGREIMAIDEKIYVKYNGPVQLEFDFGSN